MFGKSEWFKQTGQEGRKRPATWQGYAYLAAWAAVITAPFAYFSANSLGIESLIWLVAGLLGFAWDWKSMFRSRSLDAGREPLPPVEPGAKPNASGNNNDGIVFLDRPASAIGVLKRKFDYYVRR